MADIGSNVASWAVREVPGALVDRIETAVAFLTGVEIDVPASLASEQDMLASSVLRRTSKIPFGVPRRPGRSNRRAFDAAGSDHGTAVLPASLVDVPGHWVLDRIGDVEAEGWRVVDALIEVHDFGVGTARLTWRPLHDRAVDLDELNRVVCALDAATQPLLSAPVAEVHADLEASLGNHPLRLDLGPILGPARKEHLPEPGTVLWVASHVLATAAEGRKEAACRLIGRLAPNDYELLEHRDHVYAPGVSVSVTCSAPDRADDAVTLRRALLLQDAWWTLVWALDRLMLTLQLELVANLRELSERDLRFRAETIAAVVAHVSLYRSRIDSILASSGARDLAVWDKLATAWDLPFRLRSVDSKLHQLQTAHEEALEEAASRRRGRVDAMVFVFAAASVVASAVAVWQYAEDGPTDDSIVRLMVVAVALLLATFAIAGSLLVGRRRGRPGT